MENKQSVVIVGGGFAGRTARRWLQDDFDVTLIDAKGYFEFVPSVLRCFVEPDHAFKTILPHPEGTMIATVTAVHADEVEFANGERKRFDYCILCMGSSYSHPIKPDLTTPTTIRERIGAIQDEALRLTTAQKIVIVGGGLTGVEFAAEIVGAYSETKHVVLITSHSQFALFCFLIVRSLLEQMPAKAQVYALQWMKQNDVEVIFNERVTKWTPPFRTSSGREIEADLIYTCMGSRPSTIPIGSESQPFDVDPLTFQLRGFENVFVCGDCLNVAIDKTAFTAELTAQHVSKNILRHKGKQSLLKWPEGFSDGDSIPSTFCVSLYKDDGVLQMNHSVFTGYLAAMTKSNIERLQLGLAHENRWATSLWNVLEGSNLWISKYL